MHFTPARSHADYELWRSAQRHKTHLKYTQPRPSVLQLIHNYGIVLLVLHFFVVCLLCIVFSFN